jgi:hypothetical protein
MEILSKINFTGTEYSSIQVRTTIMELGSTIRLQALDSFIIIRASSIKDNGPMMSKMVLGKSTGQMERIFEDTLSKQIKNLANFNGLIKVRILASLLITNFKERANFFGKIIDTMKGHGKIT